MELKVVTVLLALYVNGDAPSEQYRFPDWSDCHKAELMFNELLPKIKTVVPQKNRASYDKILRYACIDGVIAKKDD